MMPRFSAFWENTKTFNTMKEITFYNTLLYKFQVNQCENKRDRRIAIQFQPAFSWGYKVGSVNRWFRYVNWRAAPNADANYHR